MRPESARCDEWANALRARDADGVVSYYAPDNVMFTLAPPLRYTPVDGSARAAIDL